MDRIKQFEPLFGDWRVESFIDAGERCRRHGLSARVGGESGGQNLCVDRVLPQEND